MNLEYLNYINLYSDDIIEYSGKLEKLTFYFIEFEFLKNKFSFWIDVDDLIEF